MLTNQNKIISPSQVPPQEQGPVSVMGGVGYGALRHTVVLDYIAGLGYETVPALPNPTSVPGFTIAKNGIVQQLTTRQALRYAGDPDVDSSISANAEKRARQYLATQEHDGRTGINAVFQSYDALPGLIVLRDQPEPTEGSQHIVKNAVFPFPAGFMRQPALRKSASAVIRSGFETKFEQLLMPSEDNFEAGNKIRERATGGGTASAAVALSYHGDMLAKVKQRENPPGTAIVLGYHDRIFPLDKMLESIDPQSVDLVLITRERHGMNSNGSLMKDVLDLFPMLEELKAARKTGVPDTRSLSERIIFDGKFAPITMHQILEQADQAQLRNYAQAPATPYNG